MVDLSSLTKGLPIRKVSAGELIITQGTKTGSAFILESGTVEVLKDGAQITTVKDSGALFGELSFLLDSDHQASVRAVTDCSVFVIENFSSIGKQPELSLYLAQVLAKRLVATNQVLAEARNQFKDLLQGAQDDTPAQKAFKTKVASAWERFNELMRTKIADF
jgi:CRP-like cAMP-binding protein